MTDHGYKGPEPFARSPVTRREGITLRVGIDLVPIAEVREAIEQFGDRYLDRLFTDAERAVCGANVDRIASRLAERFAAKEATIKVLQPEDGVTYTDIEVVARPDGSSALALHGPMGELARKAGLTGSSLSMTHSAHYAAAAVVAVAAEARAKS